MSANETTFGWHAIGLPYPVFDEPLLAYSNISLQQVESAIGPHHREMDEQDNEPGPCVYWAFRLPCGLPIALTFHLCKNVLHVLSDAPEIDHLLRHIPLPADSLWKQDQSIPDVAARWKAHHAWMVNQGRYPVQWGNSWSLWREDDNGHREIMQHFRWYRDAECTRQTYEARGHKQTYWLEKARELT